MDDDLISEKPFNNYTFNMRLFGFAKNIVVAWWFLVSISVTNAGQWRVDDSVPQPEFKKTTLPPRTLSDGKGGVYVWGFNNLIHNVNGQRSGVVIKLNATNGTHDASFVLGTSITEVLAGQVDPQGRIYMSGSAPGDSTDVGRNSRIFRILTNGLIDTNYISPVFSAEPRWFRLLGDGKLLVSQPGKPGFGVPGVDKTVRLNTDGSLDQPFSSNTPSFDWTSSFAPPVVDKQGRILLGGLVGGSAGLLARLLPTGKIDTTFVPTGFAILNGSVRGIGVQSDGKIVLAGRFTTPKTGGVSYGLIRLNDNGSLDATFNLIDTTRSGFANNQNPAGRGRLLEVLSDDKILVIGDRGLRRFHADGTIDISYPGVNFNDDHFWMEVLSDGGVLIPSDFPAGNLVGTNTVVGIIKLKSNGSLDNAFRPPVFQEEIFPTALGMQTDGRVILAGGGWSGFDSVSGVSTPSVARFDHQLILDTSYRPFASLVNFRGIIDQVLAPDNTLFANVDIGLDDGYNSYHIFKVSASGVRDPAFDFPGDDISELHWANGLLVGRSVSSQAIIDRVPLVQRLTPSGAVDSSYVGFGSAQSISQVIRNSGQIANHPFDMGDVSMIKAGSFSIGRTLPDGRSYASILNTTNYTLHWIVRLKVDGSFDPSFSPVAFDVSSSPFIHFPIIQQGSSTFQIQELSPPDNPLTSGTVLADGSLLVCGSFTHVQGFATPGMVRIHPDGSIDKTFNIGTGASYSDRLGLSAIIYKVVQLQTGQLLILGRFDQFNEIPVDGMVILESNGAVSLETPSDVSLPSSAFEESSVDAFPFGNDQVILVGPFVRRNSIWPTAVTKLIRDPKSARPKLNLNWFNSTTLRMSWPSIPGRRYSLMQSSDLKEWQVQGKSIEGNGSESMVDLPVEINRSIFFFVLEE